MSVYQNVNKRRYVVWLALRVDLRIAYATAVSAYAGNMLRYLLTHSLRETAFPQNEHQTTAPAYARRFSARNWIIPSAYAWAYALALLQFAYASLRNSGFGLCEASYDTSLSTHVKWGLGRCSNGREKNQTKPSPVLTTSKASQCPRNPSMTWALCIQTLVVSDTQRGFPPPKKGKLLDINTHIVHQSLVHWFTWGKNKAEVQLDRRACKMNITKIKRLKRGMLGIPSSWHLLYEIHLYIYDRKSNRIKIWYIQDIYWCGRCALMSIVKPVAKSGKGKALEPAKATKTFLDICLAAARKACSAASPGQTATTRKRKIPPYVHTMR